MPRFRQKRIEAILLIVFTLLACINVTAEDKDAAIKTKAIEYQYYTDTQSNITVDAHVVHARGDVLKVVFISQPHGFVQLKNARLISPEGIIHGPNKTFEISEEAAKNLGLLRPVPVPKNKKSKSTKAKIGSFILGTALSSLSGSSTPRSYDAYHTARQAHSGLSALGLIGGLAPAMLSQTGSGSSADEDMELEEPPSAGTGIFSSIAEFSYPSDTSSTEPWHLEAEMVYPNKKIGPYHYVATYTFTLQPGHFISESTPPLPPAEASEWDQIKLTGPASKLLPHD